MERRELGRTGIWVSRLAFGTLPFKLHEMPISDGAELLVSAAEMGIDFFDLAEIYGSYPHMQKALKHMELPPIIAAKSMAKDASSMITSINTALREIGVPRLDIFKLHNVDSVEDLNSRLPAWEELVKAKSKGLIRAIGVSTHSCRVLEEVISWPELDVVLVVFNRGFKGVVEGTMAEMLDGIKAAHSAGKGVYIMKALGGGLLYANAREALEFAFSVEEADSVAVGMHSLQEVIYNVAVCKGEAVPPSVETSLKQRKRRWHVRPFCRGCGACISACRYGALRMGEKTPVADEEKCILCGYCGFECPAMAIKIL
ncbi:MAG: aldo/keto reductase [Armatimonadota bacterium]|nr:aldo/keto reductase [Armatimonadota bacterium]